MSKEHKKRKGGELDRPWDATSRKRRLSNRRELLEGLPQFVTKCVAKTSRLGRWLRQT